ncbi:MAG: AAA family ATPase [Candidatus Micrarchaeota archaeon]|nr:AAA family ATPase [Candidatus Micrarchaeota archaeon]
MERISTGIPGLDEIIEGGIPKGFLILLSGGPGTGKTIFGLKFIYEGAKAGEKGIFVSLEEDPEQILKNTERFGWDIKKLMKTGKMDIVRMDVYDFSTLRAKIEEAILKLGAERIVIDPATIIGMYLEKPIEIRKGLVELTSRLKKTGVTSIISCEIPEGSDAVSPFGVEEFLADGIIVLKRMMEGNMYTRVLTVLKMRGTDHSTKLHPLKIGNHGIEVYAREEVFL